MPVSFVSPANEYRIPDGVTAEQYVEFLANELEDEILKVGPETVCAFIMEPVVGAAGCIVPAPAGYAQAIQAVCRKHGVLLISDEVMSGAGRTGTWRALEHDGVEPDIMSVAKGLGGGFLPLAATIYQKEIGEVLTQKDGGLMSGHTFTAHTAGCAAALKVQQIIEEENLVDRVKTKGAWFGRTLQEALSHHPHVGDVRGRGFFWGVEIVEDKATKRPFARKQQMAERLGQQLREEGLLLYPVSGFGTEQEGDGVIIAPAYNAEDDVLEQIIGRTERAITKLFA